MEATTTTTTTTTLRTTRHLPGWCASASLEPILQQLDLLQRRRGVRGHMLEIGVHHGKLFLLLAQLLQEGERALAVDLFGNQAENLDHSGHGDLEAFSQNARNLLEEEGLLDSVQVLGANSAALRPSDLTAALCAPSLALSRREGEASSGDCDGVVTSFRMVSIDGCHSCKGVAEDMELVLPCLHGGGLLLCDDVYHVAWEGAYQGTSLFLLRHPEFRVVYASPVIRGTNKVVLCEASWAPYYFAYLRDVHEGTRFINYVREQPWSTLAPRRPREEQAPEVPSNVPNHIWFCGFHDDGADEAAAA